MYYKDKRERNLIRTNSLADEGATGLKIKGIQESSWGIH